MSHVVMNDEIRKVIQEAALNKQKMAMFHFQVLKNATALESVDPESFCREIGVPDTYKTEFIKMLGLARIMQQQGVCLV